MRKVKRVLIEYDDGETKEIGNVQAIMFRPSTSLLAGYQPNGTFRVMKDLIVVYTPDSIAEDWPLIEVGA